MPNPKHDWIIPAFVPKPGLVLLVGEPKAGKTSLAIQLALAIGQGRDFLGKPANKRRVLYIQGDTSELVWRTMLYNYRTRGVDLGGDVHVIHPQDALYGIDIMTPDGTAYVREALLNCDPDVVIVDVLREMHSADEQNSTAMKAVVNQLMALLDGRTVILLHHTRKLDPSLPVDPMNASRGTSYIPGRADIVWLLNQSKLHIKGRLAPATITPLRRLPSGLWSLI